MKIRILQFSRAWLAFIVVGIGCGVGATRAAAQCVTFPSGYIPFTQIYTTYNLSPGYLVMGAMNVQSYGEMTSLPLPSATDEMFCGPVQLAPGHYYYAYVPTASERYGNFSAYSVTLIDPLTTLDILNNILPPDAIGAYFPWHVVGPAPPPSYFTQLIINEVNALYTQSPPVLTSGQDNSLVKELQHAIQMMNAGKINGAVGNLKSFISEVQDLENSSVLTYEQATDLINAANNVIAELT